VPNAECNFEKRFYHQPKVMNTNKPYFPSFQQALGLLITKTKQNRNGNKED
jgi:hypothetical protein